MSQINTIVFDLGGVLIDWNPKYLYRKIFSTEEEMNWFLDTICTSDWNEEQDGGRSLKEATEILVAAHPEQEANIRAFYDRWVEMLGGPIEGTVDVFRQIKSSTNYNTYALTNWSAETFPTALSMYDFLHWFDGRLVSGEEMTRKPFMIIYEKLVSRFNIDPSRSIYIDDNLRNLHPAKEIGFNVIHFSNPDQLRGELKALGVEI